MDRLVENSIGLMCHWARIVPAAGVYASTTMLAFRLQGADEGLHIASWLIFVISAGLLALTSHRTFSGIRIGRIAVALAMLSVVRLLNDPPSQADGWSIVQDKLKPIVADFLRNASLIAIVVSVGIPAPMRFASDADFRRLEGQSSRWSHDVTSRSRSWSSQSSWSLSDRFVGPRMADWLSEVSSIYFKHMGPKSKTSSRSSRSSDISLLPEPDRIETTKALWIQLQAQIAMEGSQDQHLQTVRQGPCELP